jgi:methylglutaconyl-CoA hydratase
METIRITSSGPVMTVALNRPARCNAFDDITTSELTEIFTQIPDTTRAVILTGAGDIFCAGADVHWMKRSVDYTHEENERDALAMSHMLRAIDECPAPVIARVNGHCLGGGMGLIGASDIVVAVDTARFGYTEVRLGVEPAIISPVSLPKIGARYARRYYLTGEQFDAVEAARIGLVHEVVATGDLDRVTDVITGEILKSGPTAVRTAKRLIREVLPLDRDQAERVTIAAIARGRVSAEGQEGFAAFLEKRKPGWAVSAQPAGSIDAM